MYIGTNSKPVTVKALTRSANTVKNIELNYYRLPILRFQSVHYAYQMKYNMISIGYFMGTQQ